MAKEVDRETFFRTRESGGTNPGADRRIRRHPTGFASSRLSAGLLSRQLARLDIVIRHGFSDGLQMGIGIQHRMRTGAGSEKQYADRSPDPYCVHTSRPPFLFSVASRASTVLDVTPSISTRLVRLFAPA